MKTRKVSVPILVVFLLSVFLSSARANEVSVFGPKDCDIGYWHLHFSRSTFGIDEPGDGVIVIKKNTPDADLAGGFLFFNWRLIPLRNFLRGDDLIVYKDTRLRAVNRLTVLLRGDPGASVSVEVRKLDTPVPLPEITFIAEPMALTPGESATLTWETQYADLVILDHDIGEVPISGSSSVTPEETTTYVLAAIGPGGSTTESVTVRIDPLPPSVEITTTPASIHAGETALLNWVATNADTCAIEPDIGVVGLSGSMPVSPSETTTYAVVATGPGGMDTAETTLTVTAEPPGVAITAEPESVHMGETTLLSWNTTNAQTCAIVPDVGDVDPTGSVTVSLTETTTYTITVTGPGGSTSASVTVTMVNSTPVAEDQSVTLDEDTPLTIGLGGSDADGDVLAYTVETQPTYGTLMGDLPQPTFLPYADYYGTDSFTFTVSDGQAVSEPATVTITVSPVNDSPKAQDDIVSTQEDTPVITANLLVNDTDPENDTLTVSAYTQPEYGAVTETENGVFTYAPSLNFYGSDSFAYTVEDPHGAEDTATVTVTVTPVNDPPRADAGPDQAVVAGDTVWLDGAGAADADGDSLIYEWLLTEMPAQSGAVLSDSAVESPTFIADVPGAYVVQLIVADGTTQSPPDTVTVTADPRMVLIPDVTESTQASAESTLVAADLAVGTISSENSDTVAEDYVISQSPSAGTSVEAGSPVDLTVSLGSASTVPEVSLSATPATIQPGESLTLSWTATNADAGFIQPGVGGVPASGTVTVSPAHTTRYEITVFGTTGCDRAEVTVFVAGTPEWQPKGSFGAVYEDLIPVDATVDAYSPRRFSLVTGLVEDPQGEAVSGVAVTILHRPEYGTALTDTQGRFSLPVEGGGPITVRYGKPGRLSIHRTVDVPWNDIAVVDTVVMISPDPATTTVTFDGNAGTVYTHESTVVTDAFGARACSTVFTGDNRAYMVDEDGNDVRAIDTFVTRSTEYPVPESMPARLPPTTAFTYCVELEVDGVSRVRFEKPITVWVDNFLGFEVGDVVPVGWYDRSGGNWIPAENGVVVALLDANGDGVVDALDADGDGLADDLDGDGDPGSEVIGMTGGPYSAGACFWRIETTHFSPCDLNWPTTPPADATGPTADGDVYLAQQEAADCLSPCGSYVEARSRILHQDIAVPGTDMTLHYAANRVDGHQRKITVPVSGDTIPGSLSLMIVDVVVAGRRLRQTLPALPNQVAEFVWDGADYLGRPVKRSVRARVTTSFLYDYVYLSSGAVGWAGAKAFGQLGMGLETTGVLARQSAQMSDTTSVLVQVPTGRIAEGWTLSSHHQLSPVDMFTVHKGDGSLFQGATLIIDTVAGNHTYGCGGDGGPAGEAQIGGVREMDIAPDGSIYVADPGCGSVRRIDAEGIMTTFAGAGSRPPEDGNAAVEVALDPTAVAVGKNGDLFIATINTVYRVDKRGVIFRFAGTGSNGFSGDGGPATAADLYYIQGLDVDRGGNVYIADKRNCRIRRVTTDGMITTIAGNGITGYTGEDGPAVEAGIGRPDDVAIGPDGGVYIAASSRIRRVDPDGIIRTLLSGYSPKGLAVGENKDLYFEYDDQVYRLTPDGVLAGMAGTGRTCYSQDLPCGDGGPARYAELNFAWDVALGPDGGLYLLDSANSCIRKIAPPAEFSPIWMGGDIPVSETSDLGYIMTPGGQHKETIDPDTGVTLRAFQYDDADRLTGITDPYGNETRVERNADGTPWAIRSHTGVTTTLGIDEKNHLTDIIYPDGETYLFEYTPDGLLTAKVEPAGNRFEYAFDPAGRVSSVVDGEGGHWQYQRSAYDNGETLTEEITGEGNVTSYLDRTDATGTFLSTITAPTGAETTFVRGGDGLAVSKTLPCGMALDFTYDLDAKFKFKYLKRRTVQTPSGLENVTTRDRLYEDADTDGLTDLVTETVTINGKETRSVHDTLQSMRTVTSPEGRTATTVFDPSTLAPVSIAVPGLDETTYAYDAQGRMIGTRRNSRETSFTYNSQGFLESITGATGNTTWYDYDPAGRITQIHRPDGGAVSFTYDGNSNMRVLTNPLLIDHGFSFNSVNKRTAYHTPLSGSYSYVYDKDRRLVQTDFPSGNRINNIYGQGRLAQIQTPEGNVDLTYICGTQLSAVTKGPESIGYGYDGTLVISETLSGTLNQSMAYTYDNDFNVVGFAYAGGTEGYVYDEDGLLAAAGGFTIGRNAVNGLPESVSGGAVNVNRTFNGYGEVESQSLAVNSVSLNESHLTRDDTGRIIQKTETVGGITSTYFYAYDSAGRLLTVTRDGSLVEEYQYGLNGTRTYEMNMPRGIAGRTFEYSDEDCLLTAGTTTYDYDADGFLTTKTQAGAVTTYDYSSRGELLAVTLPDNTIVEYTYDPLGRRIAKSVDGVTIEKYLWQGLTRLLAVYDGADNLLMRFQYADDRMPVAMTRNNETYYLAYDPVGSLRMVSDTVGDVVKQIRYDTFGNVIADTNPSFAVPFGFAGGLYDTQIGLIRFGLRDYDPDTGRWTAKDPIFFSGGATDLYGYCMNDPVNFFDPSGLILWNVVGRGAIKVVGGVSAIATGAAAASTPTVVGQIAGVALAIGGSTSVSYGVSQVIAGLSDNEIPFMGTKEAIIRNTTSGLTQKNLLAADDLINMVPGIASGRLNISKSDIGQAIGFVQHGLSIGKSAEQIKRELEETGLFVSKPCP